MPDRYSCNSPINEARCVHSEQQVVSGENQPSLIAPGDDRIDGVVLIPVDLRTAQGREEEAASNGATRLEPTKAPFQHDTDTVAVIFAYTTATGALRQPCSVARPDTPGKSGSFRPQFTRDRLLHGSSVKSGVMLSLAEVLRDQNIIYQPTRTSGG